MFGMMGTWTMGWMWIWPVLIVVGLCTLGYVMVRMAQGGPVSTPTGNTARGILDERLARGEIDEDEYQRRRSLLA